MKLRPLMFVLPTVLLTATLATPAPAQAQAAEPIFEVCNEAGICSVVAPEVGAAYVIIDLLLGELQKEHPFGESNEITKAINELNKFILYGMGPNNDLRKFLEVSGIDRLLQNLGIKLFS